jgi:hypothetical protein
MQTDKTLLKFLLRFTLINFIWIIPVGIFCLQGIFLSILFFSFLVSFTYLSWLQYFNKKPVLLQKVVASIKILYYLCVIIFLVLTGVATYKGIVNVFGLVGWLHLSFAVVFAIGIPLTLFVITLMIKERKTPSFIFAALILYLLFDAMTALPYNFLFFYENVKCASNIEYDKKNLCTVIDACDSIITPKYSISVVNLSRIRSQLKSSIAENDLNSSRGFKFDSSALETQLQKGTIDPKTYKSKYNALQTRYRPKAIKRSQEDNDAFNVSFADSVGYRKLLDELARCKSMKLDLDNANNTDSAGKLSKMIKIDLIPICNGSNDTKLKSYVKMLYPNKPSSLESIKQLYRFIGNKIVGNETQLVENEESNYDKGSDMLIMMSLSSSLVIDILPLLLSLLYAKFKRDE